jgi:hypothetical protein
LALDGGDSRLARVRALLGTAIRRPRGTASPPPLVAGDHNVIIVVTGPDQLKQLRDPVEPALRKKGRLLPAMRPSAAAL